MHEALIIANWKLSKGNRNMGQYKCELLFFANDVAHQEGRFHYIGVFVAFK